MTGTGTALRIVVGCDDAGLDLKEVLAADLRADERVASVTDVGVHRGEERDYPHVAVEAARMVAGARPTARSSCAGRVLASRSRRTRSRASAP